MAPVVLAAELLQVLLEQGAHADDPFRHALDLAEPLRVQRGVIEDLGRNPSTVDRWVGVEWSDEDLDLRIHPLLLFRRRAHDREGSDPLAIESLDRVSATGPLEPAKHGDQVKPTMFFAKLCARAI